MFDAGGFVQITRPVPYGSKYEGRWHAPPEIIAERESIEHLNELKRLANEKKIADIAKLQEPAKRIAGPGTDPDDTDGFDKLIEG